MAKIADICVKVGTNSNGKGRYQNVGAVIQTQNGEMFLLNRTFNPAGVPCDPDKDSIILSVFPVREKEEQTQKDVYPPHGTASSSLPDDDDIPF